MTKGLGAFVALALGAAGMAGSSAVACIVVGGGTTKIAGEEVVIAWDAARHREHFVRRLSFRDASPDFGFLVPTPGRPELGEVDGRLFDRLFDVYHRQPEGDGSRLRGIGHAAAGAPPVQVIETQRVAGLDATVLLATDSAALTAWLGEHHYPASPSLARYLAPYVQQHYYVTAFRYAPGVADARFGTRAVRMSFDTDRAYFPYAEPDDATVVPDRVFRLSVIARERMEGSVGRDRWRAVTRYAARAPGLAMLRQYFPPGPVDGFQWITTFEERGAARGRDDLFFTRTAIQAPVASSITTRIE